MLPGDQRQLAPGAGRQGQQARDLQHLAGLRHGRPRDDPVKVDVVPGTLGRNLESGQDHRLVEERKRLRHLRIQPLRAHGRGLVQAEPAALAHTGPGDRGRPRHRRSGQPRGDGANPGK